MKIHFIHPFSLEKNYGKELNETMAMIAEGDWCAIMDWDCMLLTSDQIENIYHYVGSFPGTGMFVAPSGRCGSIQQRLEMCDFDSQGDIIKHHNKAQNVLKQRLETKEMNANISGYFMIISKATWNEIKFNEELQILSVDRDYARRLISAGKRILLMKNIYIWHSYRIWKNSKDTTHLI